MPSFIASYCVKFGITGCSALFLKGNRGAVDLEDRGRCDEGTVEGGVGGTVQIMTEG